MSHSPTDSSSKPALEELEKGEISTVIVQDEKRLERIVKWKLDSRVLPPIAILFLCTFFDRTNVGNARLYGLEGDLGITDSQYDLGLAIFYVTYIVVEIPSNMTLKRVTGRRWLPFLAFAWGVSSMCLGFIQNYPAFLGIRALLGACEGGILPGIILYLSGLYKRTELALRIGLFYTATSLSGAFSGLLARGIAELGTAGGLSSWRWIFVLEGAATAVISIIVYFFLPANLSTAWFFTEEERAYAVTRTQGLVTTATPREVEAVEKFQWAEFGRGIFNIQVWLTATAYFGILSGLYSFGLFLPTIIAGLGYTANEALLLSVCPYAVAAVVTVGVAFTSDYLRKRGPVMLCTMPIAIIGYAVIANVDDSRVKYGMTFMMATGLFCSVPPVLGWLSNNSAGHYKRATSGALQLMIANCGGFMVLILYPKSQGPRYYEGHTIVMSLLCAGWLLILLNVLYCRKINKDKANGKYVDWTGCGDDRDPNFRLVL
ncbi:major facilitator superfamily transporter [Whalleya microplaca]|nr:major facilitator superfamily transporter [Whalleya microplaca]